MVNLRAIASSGVAFDAWILFERFALRNIHPEHLSKHLGTFGKRSGRYKASSNLCRWMIYTVRNYAPEQLEDVFLVDSFLTRPILALHDEGLVAFGAN